MTVTQVGLHRTARRPYPKRAITPILDRFWRYSNEGEPDQCWEWTGKARHPFGYGVFGLGTRQAGTMQAHRFSYQLYVGPIPDGMCVLHKCDNPPCVNPDHLFLGTRADNNHDMIAKGRYRGWNAAR
jgi:hypothetical protein